MAPQLQTKVHFSLRPRTWNVPSDDDYRPNQHPSDGKQARSAHSVQAVGQLWPNEIQKQALGEGHQGLFLLG